MPTVRDLRDRIRSLKNTQQITKAMKQVAAARIRRAEQLQKQSRPYADAIGEMLRDLMASVGSVDHPFMKPGREGAPRGIILVTADKGLAGAFNSNIIRVAEQNRREGRAIQWYSVGIKGRNSLRRTSQEPADFWAQSQGDKLANAQAIARKVTDAFIAGEISEVSLISSRFVSMMVQRPELRKLIPIEAPAKKAASDGAPRGSVEFEPSPEDVLARLLPKYLEFTIYSALLETDACFFAAQLIAMNNATENAGKLIDELTVVMNNARQAAITKELLEIVGGAEALQG
jgi:F-type H+-transporting ATPase subunit gamma